MWYAACDLLWWGCTGTSANGNSATFDGTGTNFALLTWLPRYALCWTRSP